MRVAVFAYHDIGYECLRFLIGQGEEIVAVVTHEDDPEERIWFRSVADLARSHDLPLYAPRNPNDKAFVALMRGLSPDLILSFYYRRLLSKELLALPRLGGINLHGSLLPKYRGRSPVNWVLVNGETETGVTLHYMIEEADAGDIIAQRKVLIDLEDTALTLFRKITVAGVELLRETFPLIKAGRAPRVPQDSSVATAFGRRRPEDGKISWRCSAWSIYNLVRAVTHPYPGAFTFLGGRKLYIWAAAPPIVDGRRPALGEFFNPRPTEDSRSVPGTIEAVEKAGGILVSTGDGFLLVTRAQYDGEEELSADQFAERYGLSVGTKLGK